MNIQSASKAFQDIGIKRPCGVIVIFNDDEETFNVFCSGETGSLYIDDLQADDWVPVLTVGLTFQDAMRAVVHGAKARREDEPEYYVVMVGDELQIFEAGPENEEEMSLGCYSPSAEDLFSHQWQIFDTEGMHT